MTPITHLCLSSIGFFVFCGLIASGVVAILAHIDTARNEASSHE